MATLNGAKALGLGDVTGSLTVGKRADIILIRGNDINVAPLANIETTVVQSATPANVDTVLVDGRIVKRQRQARRLRRGEDRAGRQGVVAAHPHRGRRLAHAACRGQIIQLRVLTHLPRRLKRDARAGALPQS